MQHVVAWIPDAPLAGEMLCGLSLPQHVLVAARSVCADAFFSPGITDVQAALTALPQDADAVLICPADVPLVCEATFRAMLAALKEADAVAVTCGQPAAIICCRADALRKTLAQPDAHALQPWDAEQAAARLAARGVRALNPATPDEAIRVTDFAALSLAAQHMRQRINAAHMAAGVRLVDPAATYIDAQVRIAPGVTIYPGCMLEGNTRIAAGCTLLPNCRLRDTQVAEGVHMESTVALDAHIGPQTTVGPFAYLRPGSRIGAHCRVGDFVEIKNSVIGDGTKVSHLTYVGDSDLGRDINLGCGVVFVNYDGKAKHHSAVADGAFIGCNVNLISPVRVGKGAYVAAGSTVTEDVPDGALCVARQRQSVKEGWVAARKAQGKL
ncbi:MAG: UDP-N-acetylglucosamine pyrophosphorylase [Oscillospiraceae bacterium]|jgi:UDP-N-acetylglucosamine diphosphorylase/glucosamine-1-phosphate N-acetyltransferase|nr:UDP-N-acetylglucosamine pyrophosphorylase [Oscillospiraceae bacterium]